MIAIHFITNIVVDLFAIYPFISFLFIQQEHHFFIRLVLVIYVTITKQHNFHSATIVCFILFIVGSFVIASFLFLDALLVLVDLNHR